MTQMHDEIVDRLRRIEGQVSGIRRMEEAERYCIDVLDQISAARAALDAAAVLILQNHMNTCVREAVETGDGDTKVAEMISAVKRFVRSK